MRIIDQIPHPSMRISIFEMNLKYILKLEWGPLEQSYKFETTDFSNLGNFKEIVGDEAFLKSSMDRFIEMKSSYEALI